MDAVAYIVLISPSFDVIFHPSTEYLNIVNVMADITFGHELIFVKDHFLSSASLKQTYHSRYSSPASLQYLILYMYETIYQLI